MTLSVKDASGATQTIKTNDDMAGTAGTPNANVITVQGASGGTALSVAVANFPASQAVSGSVTVSNLPATQPVSGTFWQATQPISATALPVPTGAATDASLGTIGLTPPTLPGSSTGIMGLLRWLGNILSGTLSVAVSNFPATQPVSATSLPLPTGASTAANQASLVTTTAGTAARMVLVDPATGNGSLVQAFHNSDDQAVSGKSYGLFTGGVDQLLNANGRLDRKRAVAGDGMAGTGIAAEVQMIWNGTSYDRRPGSPALGAKGYKAPYTAAAAITPGTAVTAGRAAMIVCTVAGNQSLKLSGGTTITIPVNVGLTVLDDFAVTDAPATGTTATATVTVLA